MIVENKSFHVYTDRVRLAFCLFAVIYLATAFSGATLFGSRLLFAISVWAVWIVANIYASVSVMYKYMTDEGINTNIMVNVPKEVVFNINAWNEEYKRLMNKQNLS